MSTNEHIDHAMRLHATQRSGRESILSMAPSAFAMFSATDIARQAFDLVSNAIESTRFMSVLVRAQVDLRSTGVPILVNQHRDYKHMIAPSDLKRPQRRWLGQVALELYFTQLFRSDSAILDMSLSRLGVSDAGGAVWYPLPLYSEWDPDFLEAVRDMYAGFFLADEQRFGGGIKQLGLGSAGGRVLQHLGGVDQRCVRFRVAELQSTLREVSAARTNDDGPVHRNLMALGIYVTSLYELLEYLDLTFDVRSAFMRVHRGQLGSDGSIGIS